MFNAYEIAETLSKAEGNPERKEIVIKLANQFTSLNGHTKKLQNIIDRYFTYKRERPILDIYGNQNIILDSGFDNVFLLTAHYDAVTNGDFSLPGANDNGSGVGAVFQSGLDLVNLPVDLILFGSEERDLEGSGEYLLNNKKNIMGVINLDCCGSGVLSVPTETEDRRVVKKRLLNSETINNHIINITKQMNIAYDNRTTTASDHSSFLEKGIKATSIQGYNSKFFYGDDGVNGHIHTKYDTVKYLDKNFLNDVVKVTVKAIKSYLNCIKLSN